MRGEVETFEPLLWGEALRQGLFSARQVTWLSDGGAWLWNLVDRLRVQCPQLVAILDFYHASQNLWKGVEKCFDGETEAAKRYFLVARHHLRHGDPTLVLKGLRTALDLPFLSAEANKLLHNACAYLDKHLAHIQYADFKGPIGSGFVESTCKWLVQQRFKGVGMRWSEAGFDNLIALRVAWVNERFDLLFAPAEEASKCAA